MNRHHKGFTLIELMTALTVLGVLLAMAVPSFREFTRSNRVTAAQNDLVTAFTLARSEALKRGTPVTVCASSDGVACSGATDWATGWIVFSDGNGTAGTIDAGDEALQRWSGANSDLTVTGTDSFLRYTATGMVSPVVATAFDVYATGCTGEKMRRVGVSPIGLVAATLQACP
ncbi:MAG: GspH/FimT family pseudopilin [Gammaproteobacteria bacterium]